MEHREYKQLTEAGRECNKGNELIQRQSVGEKNETIIKKMQKAFWIPSQHFVSILI